VDAEPPSLQLCAPIPQHREVNDSPPAFGRAETIERDDAAGNDDGKLDWNEFPKLGSMFVEVGEEGPRWRG
jgi:hypothetical protein